jgi:hypothetical protein
VGCRGVDFLSAFFLTAYISLYERIPGLVAIQAVFLTIGLCVWNDLAHKLLPSWYQIKHRWQVGLIYAFGCINSIFYLWTRIGSVETQNNIVWMEGVGIQLPDIIYSLFQVLASVSILYNYRAGIKVGAGLQNRQFLAASLLAIAATAYSVLALALPLPLPRFIFDGLLFGGVLLLGLAVARYQVLIERRGRLQDFFISALLVFVLVDIYLFFAWQMGLAPVVLVSVTALTILSHSSYNLVREFLDRSRSKEGDLLGQQLRHLEANVDRNISLQERLQTGLELLCESFEAAGAFIAVRRASQYIVLASCHSIPRGSALPHLWNECNDIYQPSPEMVNDVAWLVPVFQRGGRVAVLGVGPLKSGLPYTDDDLNSLVETADRIGIILYLHSHKPAPRARFKPMGFEVQSSETHLSAGSEELLPTLVTKPDLQFIKMIEDGLRNLTDFINLGQSPLPECLGIHGETHLEKGKAVQQKLIEAIEALRPAMDCPGEPIPREWHSYVVLHDAYWERTPNHEIMSKLYVSEGTFHRTRRAAVRAVARVLLEKKKSSTP